MAACAALCGFDFFLLAWRELRPPPCMQRSVTLAEQRGNEAESTVEAGAGLAAPAAEAGGAS